MKTYITPKILLLLVFSLLLIARGVGSAEKAPPTTLQIGTNPLPPPSYPYQLLRPPLINPHLPGISRFVIMHLKRRNQTPRPRRTMYSQNQKWRLPQNALSVSAPNPTVTYISGTLWSNGEVFYSSYDRYETRG